MSCLKSIKTILTCLYQSLKLSCTDGRIWKKKSNRSIYHLPFYKLFSLTIFLESYIQIQKWLWEKFFILSRTNQTFFIKTLETHSKFPRNTFLSRFSIFDRPWLKLIVGGVAPSCGGPLFWILLIKTGLTYFSSEMNKSQIFRVDFILNSIIWRGGDLIRE